MMTAIVDSLTGLKLHGMAERLPELMASNQSKVSLQTGLIQLIEAEQADREVRRLRYQMSAARFPHHRDLHQFNFEQSEVDEQQIRDL
ncbi:MAG: ATP-binding protein, partial [Gammaproteobacteria bacterium]|nr:ATP-binding protein [Gammaproteobacteria bacterium]